MHLPNLLDRVSTEEQDTPTVHAADGWRIFLRVARASIAHRTTGHAAEMAFFAVLTLVPSTVAVGSALAVLRGVVGPGPVSDAENAAVHVVRTLMGPDLSQKVIAPFIHAQLSQPQGGVALGGLLAAWWLSSHLFMATSHALDYAYGVRDRRPTVVQRFIALAFALGSVAVVALTVELMVTGPLGNPQGVVARQLGIGHVYSIAWSILRWPVLLLTIVAFLMCLYRFSPNVRQRWGDCLPGALAGATLWILAAAAFRVAATFGLNNSAGVAADDPTVAIIGQAVNAVVATVLWAYLASVAILVGGELNAQLRASRPISTIARSRVDG
jgi:membrane protein